MAKADSKPKINTLKGDRATLAERSLKARKDSPVTKAQPKAKPATGSAGGGGKKPPTTSTASGTGSSSSGKAGGNKAVSTQVRQPRTEKYMGKAERVQSYLKNSSSQIKSGIKELKAKPASVLKRLFSSLPQGRAAKVAAAGVAGAGAAYTAGGMVDKAVASNTKSAAEKQKAYAAARDDIPSVASKAKAESKPKASAPAAKGAAKSGAKGDVVKTVRTKGGDYPVYKKNSSQAASFRAAFAAARKDGKKVFTWEGRKYNTKLKGE